MGFFKDFFGFDMPGRVTVFLWTAGTAFMVGFSVHDLCPIITDYLNVDENVNVRIEKTESPTIKPPSLYFCLPTSNDQFVTQILEYERQKKLFQNSNASCPICDGLKKNSWDVWSRLDFSDVLKNQTEINPMENESPGHPDFKQAMKRMKTEIFLSFIHRIFSNLSDIEYVLSSNNSDWHQPIVESILMFFGIINENDAYFHLMDLFNNKTNPVDAILTQRSNSEIDYLHTQLVKLKSSQINIINKEIYKFIQQEILTASFVVTPAPSLETYQYCFRGRNFTQGLTFQTEPEFFKYSINWGPILVSANDPFNLINAPTPIYKVEPNSFGQSQELVQLIYNIQAQVKEERPGKHCFKHESRGDCLQECRLKKIMALCSCLPFRAKTFAFLDDQTYANLTYCNFHFYRACYDKFPSEDEECTKKCAVACEYTFYQWQTTSTSNPNKDAPLINVQIFPSVAPYMEFTLAVRDNKYNLISQIGGIFNFYLGLSGLSIFALLIFLIECYSRWRQRKASGGNGNAGEEGHNVPTLHMIKLASIIAAARNRNKEQEEKPESALQKEVDSLKETVKDLVAKFEIHVLQKQCDA